MTSVESGERRTRGRPRAFHDKTEQNTIKSLDRALVVLRALSRSEGIALSELARQLGESPATLYRILVTYQRHNMVDLDEETQGWRIGSGAFLVGSAFLRRTSLVERARPIMRELMEDTGETANLGIRRGGEVLFLSQVETHAPIRAFFPPGTLSPLHASGIGKALLSQMNVSHLEKLLGELPLESFTEKTHRAADTLTEDLKRASADGFAVDDEERTEGMRCVAAPVFNAFGEAVAGISVSGPTSRVSRDDVPRLGAAVQDAAKRLTAAIGG
ncbi:HTH-type transcriptional regulator BhcR [Qingshengfaniella alkalisoli]|uniref:IclR family transcriptional regulator n=1 Tax=Qingshengfaniella alkalisoli TaxID=2599296 RepID=A0A5B8I883_9RHOB|nr:HTH-type transcriptional regulator BhcR [Qingshengfaniella alkalisoli]QDY68836.1 IclR family transcriptional regulator [Qingshengfaniella alkalisoli]